MYISPENWDFLALRGGVGVGKGQKSKHNPWILISFHSLITEIQKLSRFPLFPSLLTTKSNFGNPFFPEKEKDEERVQSAICSLFTFGLTPVRRPCFEFNRVLGAPYSPISSLASQKKTMGEMQGPTDPQSPKDIPERCIRRQRPK